MLFEFQKQNFYNILSLYYVQVHMHTLCIIIIISVLMYIYVLQISSLAWKIQQKYFTANSEGTRQVAFELQSILKNIEDTCLAHDSDVVSDGEVFLHSCLLVFFQSLDSGMGWKEELQFGLQALSDLLKEENTLSAFEIHSSSLVQVLLHCISGQVAANEYNLWIVTVLKSIQFSEEPLPSHKISERFNLFMQVFFDVDKNAW